jgi:class 3 adenylate cyclase
MELPGEFPFCPYCTAPLTGENREQRKTVTLLFCDVTGSTALGESTDPEALRALLARYFERMKAIVESHGGTVEKFIGDAVMAVFGVPAAHEDDALRACRTAVEMRDALPELGIRGRIGVNTGEVVTGTSERLATGDAVNVAARLEQAAEPGEVLIGESTYALVREAVGTELIEPLKLKGKTEPVLAYRLVSLLDAPERSHASRFVGREDELDQISAAWVRAISESCCELVTVLGEAGVGKSQLVAEALALTDCRTVSGRCLPYGEGITYWPVVEVLKQLGTLPSDPEAAASIRSLLGESEQATSAEEIGWAFRKLLQEQAPLVVVFDDIQWGEETFLDLVESIALFSGNAPLLLVCMARPELIERRPSWAAPLRLEPLPVGEAEELLPVTFDDELRARIAQAAGGNPLFLTEMVAMAREADGEVTVPATLRALLAARLDQLDPEERSVLEWGSVEGEIFHRGAVQTLSSDGPVTPRLAALVRKGLIRPDKAMFPGEEAFRFHHLLFRDAAYDTLSKRVRADLHERLADWLEKHGQRLVELDELLGYHLEQAALYKAELGQPDPVLAERAGARLAVAGNRALARAEAPAAVNLLERSLSLTRQLGVDVHLELNLAWALGMQYDERGVEVALAAARRAHEEDDEPGQALASVFGAFLETWWETDPGFDELERQALAAIVLLERVEDHAGLAMVWGYALGFGVANYRQRCHEWADAAQKALEHSRLVGGREDAWLFGLPIALVWGPMPADEVLDALEALRPGREQGVIDLHAALVLAMLGRFNEAWQLGHAACERARELSGNEHAGEAYLADIAALAGDDEQAAVYLRPICERLTSREWNQADYCGRLAQVLWRSGRHKEAYELAKRCCRPAPERNVLGRTYWLQIQALHASARGEHTAETEHLARQAVTVLDRTDNLNLQAEALCNLAKVLADAGKTDDAAETLEQALDRCAQKKNLAMLMQLQTQLDAIRGTE